MPVVVTSKGHRFDRNVPPPLPPHRMLTQINPSLPSSIDARPSCGPVKDQGNEGSCTAHAGTSGAEWVFRRYFNKQPVFSPQYVYEKELIMDGDFPNDNGSDGVTLCNVLIVDGCCELSLDPYVPGEIVEPTSDQDANAAQWRFGAYHGVAGSQVALSVLGDPVPWPVEIGFTVYQSFESDWTIPGVMPVPDPNESMLGGHEVLMVGYDVGDTPSLRPTGCPPAALIQNSWGTGWGIGGFFWMPLSVLDASDTDLKIVHTGSPWRKQ